MIFYAGSQGKVLQLMDKIAFEMKGDLKLAVRNPPTALCHVPSTGANPSCSLFVSPSSFFHFLHGAPWLHRTV